jgi:ArsR family transcriptional regulator, arsenate/arsenite/antimonite-responsive transcriptional repressor
MGIEITRIHQQKSCEPTSPLPEELSLSDEEADEELARLAKAISHPVRIRILRLLAHEPGCMCGAIFQEIPLAQSTISQHLKVLREAGLIEGELDLPRICYCTRTETLLRLKQLVSTL